MIIYFDLGKSVVYLHSSKLLKFKQNFQNDQFYMNPCQIGVYGQIILHSPWVTLAFLESELVFNRIVDPRFLLKYIKKAFSVGTTSGKGLINVSCKNYDLLQSVFFWEISSTNLFSQDQQISKKSMIIHKKLSFHVIYFSCNDCCQLKSKMYPVNKLSLKNVL